MNLNKNSNVDFNDSMLPKNRFRLFFDILKNKNSLLFNLGLLTLIFSLPLIALEFIFNGIVNNIQNLNITDTEKYQEMLATTNIKNILLIIGFVILAVGLSGVTQIIRRIIFNEDILFWLDFKNGIKENAGTNIFISIIMGILNFLIQYMFIINAKFNGSYKIALGIIIAAIVIITPLCLIVSQQATIYKLKLSYKFKNAFIISNSSYFITYLLGIINIAVYLITLIDNVVVYSISLFILPVVVSPLLILVNMLVIDIYLDKFINKESFKEIYRKGLNPHE